MGASFGGSRNVSRSEGVIVENPGSGRRVRTHRPDPPSGCRIHRNPVQEGMPNPSACRYPLPLRPYRRRNGSASFL